MRWMGFVHCVYPCEDFVVREEVCWALGHWDETDEAYKASSACLVACLRSLDSIPGTR